MGMPEKGRAGRPPGMSKDRLARRDAGRALVAALREAAPSLTFAELEWRLAHAGAAFLADDRKRDGHTLAAIAAGEAKRIQSRAALSELEAAAIQSKLLAPQWKQTASAPPKMIDPEVKAVWQKLHAPNLEPLVVEIHGVEPGPEKEIWEEEHGQKLVLRQIGSSGWAMAVAGEARSFLRRTARRVKYLKKTQGEGAAPATCASRVLAQIWHTCTPEPMDFNENQR